ncbi:MAG TPA: hypothetical protein VL086_13040 [Candidatus Nitrosotalea sp.]|nr:hypothetical protein [Candidatus Nitrosotalea sp.]
MRQASEATLASVMDELARSGFGEHFGVSDGTLRSFDSGRTFSARQVVIREYRRFEGVSDPDDMSIVYAIEGQGGARGILVDAFGAYSDPTVSAFLERVPMGGAAPAARELPRFGRYAYGVPVPVPQDPSQDEGGESGSVA